MNFEEMFSARETAIDWYIGGVGDGFASKIFWKLVPGETFKLKWPSGWTDPTSDGNQTESNDPNDHYRPALTESVGRQYISWDWALKDNDLVNNTLTVKIRRDKRKWVSYFLLKWG